jgi:hypothetical protein
MLTVLVHVMFCMSLCDFVLPGSSKKKGGKGAVVWCSVLISDTGVPLRDYLFCCACAAECTYCVNIASRISVCAIVLFVISTSLLLIAATTLKVTAKFDFKKGMVLHMLTGCKAPWKGDVAGGPDGCTPRGGNMDSGGGKCNWCCCVFLVLYVALIGVFRPLAKHSSVHFIICAHSDIDTS